MYKFNILSNRNDIYNKLFIRDPKRRFNSSKNEKNVEKETLNEHLSLYKNIRIEHKNGNHTAKYKIRICRVDTNESLDSLDLLNKQRDEDN
jgi:hypothetical protein